MLEAPFGIANIEVTFPLLYTELVQTGVLGLEKLLDLLQRGPAAVMGWDAPTLEVGHPADLTVIDLDSDQPVDSRAFKSKAKFSPWEAQSLRGWTRLTFVRGKAVYQAASSLTPT